MKNLLKIESKEDIVSRVNVLRVKLNEAYEKQGNTKEVIKISQELDRYIYIAQQLKLMEKIKKENKS
ncbi:Spo0E family sporulation regulatory protein-aspartic acid phosphatase [Alkaliphilus peptidifermentans]|uniref:Spo0E like sporulation regulatory protein n=1 Tax=Alkaliphilus peptidifermentans DSM 18978 TaxID=1120976 RepID=A0A1G5AFQ7_9FIRM|nr:Spo0E family sporulation regulatory protein-aspartic acid phosphatase [Alkaliphilus peptidifermentans]SCX76689.1 Spo0E like sporulation regulatory protein [Alkaliphilus peptidifermentans DSM 18978]